MENQRMSAVDQSLVAERQENELNNKKVNHKKYNSYFKNGKGKKGVETKSKDISAMIASIPTQIRNVFKPLTNGLANRHKYCVNHIEVDLAPALVNGHVDVLNRNNIPLGGTEFTDFIRTKLRQVIGSEVNWLANLDNIEEGVYRYLYNARQMYCLLQAVTRCQNCVEAVDVDNRYLAPMLNNHIIKRFNVGYAADTFADEVAHAAIVPTANRQTYCFSFPASKAVWDRSIIAQATKGGLYITPKWRDLADQLFGKVHILKPNNYSMIPSLAVFWPDGTIIDATGGLSSRGFAGYLEYQAQANGDHWWVAMNTTLAQLQAHIDNFIAQQTLLTNDTPISALLELLEKEGYLVRATSDNFVRDLSGSKVPFAESEELTSVMRTALPPIYQARGGLLHQASRFTQHEFPYYLPYIVSKDCVPVINQKKLDVDSFFTAISYDNVSKTNGADLLSLLLVNHIAPMHCDLMIYNNAAVTYFWTIPGGQLLSSDAVVYGGFATVPEQTSAANQLLRWQAQQGILLSRAYLWNGGNVFGTDTTDRAAGISASFNYLPFYDLKDYYVPEADAESLIYQVADGLSLNRTDK